MISAQAHDPDRGVAVEVGPGGALRDLTLDSRAMGPHLARTILSLVDTATARANSRAAHALGDLTELGLAVDARLSETVEDTTPTTWRV
ncbi:hypothetical protein FHS29_005763 [Saccharothrix tamanrassetensis]|uniref:YbaB/EbfC DNA-binding family protein n=1 Tax=Saccharothrix tamanrassetensis TaxID=1051531 RepID=A0A841CQG7_9PSEU|nr:YbaB/EbfC family DNA-binding protein [Saccharothrix tamanrassetensis]MBB5959143.1 hypothetical protein [Saccharothrix tamanrassetensis]